MRPERPLHSARLLQAALACAAAPLLGLDAAAQQQEAAGQPTPDESLAQRVERLERDNVELERRVQILADEQEASLLAEVIGPLAPRVSGLGPAASKIYAIEQGVSIGGYGEVLYENFDSQSGMSDQWDALRAVLYVGYRYDEKWLFNSEIEIEHGDEIFNEFAYIDYLASPEVNLRGGVLLTPLGFLNELHEPTTFLSARRPVTETVILPSTWRENGVGLHGELGDFAYRAYLMNSFDGTGFDAGGLRGGRQKGSKALAEDLAVTARVDWQGVPGLTVGAGAWMGDTSQGLVSGGDVSTTIFEGHLDAQWRGWQARLLYAHAELDDVAALNASQGLTGMDSVGEELEGWYAELGYDVMGLLRPTSDQALIPFVRVEHVNTQEDVPAGFLADPANDLDIMTYGLHYRPRPGIAVKLDCMDFEDGAGNDRQQYNVSLGWTF